jgi:hypothetical protein
VKRRPIDRFPSSYSLGVAVGAAGFAPAALAVSALTGWLPLGGLYGVRAAAFVVAFVAGAAIPLTAPLALVTLASYRRQAPPSRRRATWTAAVLVLLAPSVYVCGAMIWVALTT